MEFLDHDNDHIRFASLHAYVNEFKRCCPLEDVPPPYTESDVRLYETEHDVKLPADLVYYLTHLSRQVFLKGNDFPMNGLLQKEEDKGEAECVKHRLRVSVLPWMPFTEAMMLDKDKEQGAAAFRRYQRYRVMHGLFFGQLPALHPPSPHPQKPPDVDSLIVMGVSDKIIWGVNKASNLYWFVGSFNCKAAAFTLPSLAEALLCFGDLFWTYGDDLSELRSFAMLQTMMSADAARLEVIETMLFEAVRANDAVAVYQLAQAMQPSLSLPGPLFGKDADAFRANQKSRRKSWLRNGSMPWLLPVPALVGGDVITSSPLCLALLQRDIDIAVVKTLMVEWQLNGSGTWMSSGEAWRNDDGPQSAVEIVAVSGRDDLMQLLPPEILVRSLLRSLPKTLDSSRHLLTHFRRQKRMYRQNLVAAYQEIEEAASGTN